MESERAGNYEMQELYGKLTEEEEETKEGKPELTLKFAVIDDTKP